MLVRGVQVGAASAVLLSTVLGLSVSTSHCLVGAVVGVGIAAKLMGTDNRVNVCQPVAALRTPPDGAPTEDAPASLALLGVFGR